MLRMVSECISYNLEFQNFLGDYPRTPHLPETGETPLSGSPSLAYFFCKIYYNVVSVAAGEKQRYTKQFSRKLA
jgi:hypothetical protein